MLPFILYAGLLALTLIGLSVWLVWAFKRRVGNRAYWLAPIPFFAALLVGSALFRVQAPNNGPPTFLPAAKLAGLIRALPDYTSFGYSGIGFYKGKLYVSTNVGLVEISGERVNGVYRFQKSDSVVSGPWLDTPDQLLWTLDDHTNQLLNFDGSVWHRVNLPQPQKGYLTRGDVLEGPKPIGNAIGFWLEDGGSVWRWNAAENAWAIEHQPSPPSDSSGVSETIGILPIGDELLFIERHELLPFLIKNGEDFTSDTVVRDDAGWHEVPNESGSKFLAGKWIVTDDAGYVCATNGLILRVTPQAITKLDAPGKCETLASTTSRTLLASFRGKGIYEYKENWKLRTAHAYPSGAGEYWTHLSENGSEIALAIDAKPVVDEQRSSGTNMKFTRNAPTRLWIYQVAKFHRVRLQ